MSQYIKYILVLAIISFYSALGMSQDMKIIKPDSPKLIQLTSPLDRLYKIPESDNTNLLKQRSIFDANKLPIFCKIEHKLSKSSNVNLRMRLGSLDYVNKLEGKN